MRHIILSRIILIIPYNLLNSNSYLYKNYYNIITHYPQKFVQTAKIVIIELIIDIFVFCCANNALKAYL